MRSLAVDGARGAGAAMICAAMLLLLIMQRDYVRPTGLVSSRQSRLRQQTEAHRVLKSRKQELASFPDATPELDLPHVDTARDAEPTDFFNQWSKEDDSKLPLPSLSLTGARGKDRARRRIQMMHKTQKLSPAGGDSDLPTAADNPVGVAAAAKILKDEEGFDKSIGEGKDALEEWKKAAKNSGPAILDSITDDATSFNPFPHQSLSEKLEIQDVWNNARKLAKPAGKLSDDPEETKKSIMNAEAQAESAAYLAANEAAAVDAYDLSMPNPDMMAKKGRSSLTGQALANKNQMHLQGQAMAMHSHHGLLSSQALAAWRRADRMNGRKNAIMSRTQALADVDGGAALKHGSKSIDAAIVRLVKQDEKTIRSDVNRYRLAIAKAQGEKDEAVKLAGADSQAVKDAATMITKDKVHILMDGGREMEAKRIMKAAQSLESSAAQQSSGAKALNPKPVEVQRGQVSETPEQPIEVRMRSRARNAHKPSLLKQDFKPTDKVSPITCALRRLVRLFCILGTIQRASFIARRWIY